MFIIENLVSFTILHWLFHLQNHEPGAEEAFKILNHAFEMIGEPVSLNKLFSNLFCHMQLSMCYALLSFILKFGKNVPL